MISLVIFLKVGYLTPAYYHQLMIFNCLVLSSWQCWLIQIQIQLSAHIRHLWFLIQHLVQYVKHKGISFIGGNIPISCIYTISYRHSLHRFLVFQHQLIQQTSNSRQFNYSSWTFLPINGGIKSFDKFQLIPFKFL
jgi:hypothetical protein